MKDEELEQKLEQTEKPYKDFEGWYTEVFGGHITKEQASDEDFEHDYSELIGETEQFLKDLEK